MPREHSQSDQRLTARQRHVAILLAVVCIVLTSAALVAADSVISENSYSDDFEDQDLAEYDTADGGDGTVEITNETWLGGTDDYELHLASPQDGEAYAETQETINLSQQTITTELDFRIDDQHGIQAQLVRLDNGADNMYLFADFGDGLDLRGSFFSNVDVIPREDLPGYESGPPPEDMHGNITINFDEDTVTVTVTNATTTWQETTPITSPVVRSGYEVQYRILRTATDDPQSDMWVDNVAVTGTTPGDLRIDAGNYMRPGTSQPYTIEFSEEDEEAYSDVTNNATLTSSDNDTLTVYPGNNTLIANSNVSGVEEVQLTAEYENRTAIKNVTVAEPSLQNIDKLPAWWKVSALFNDDRGTDTMLWLFAAVLAGITAARIASTFAGLGAYEMFVIFGWIVGDVSDGVLITSLLMAIFLGLNLAANIDYSVRQT